MKHLSHRWPLALVLLPGLVGKIDAQSVASLPAPPAVAGSVPSSMLEVSVIRFKPLKAERIIQGFRGLGRDLQSAVETLKTDGEVNILYAGTRNLRLEAKARAKFDALETRPIVIIGKPGAPIPPATALGLQLEITVQPSAAGQIGLAWEGSISWAPELLNRWQGEKFLSFAGSAVSALKTAGVIKAQDEKNTDIGLGLAQLFNPKGKPTENEIYELPVNKTISLSGSRTCQPGELIINATTAEMGNNETQTILLLIVPVVLP